MARAIVVGRGDLPLDGITIWHTRPADVAQPLAERCRAIGACVLVAPVLAIRALPESSPAWSTVEHILHRLDSYTQVIFVSGNAVRHGWPVLQRAWPEWPRSVACYAIGKTTARLLAERGVMALQAGGPKMNSEELVALPALQCLDGERVLIVRGVGGRGWLAEVLRARGARVEYLEAYWREKSDTLPEGLIRHIDSAAIDFVTATSGEAVENIVKVVDHSLHPRLLGVTIVVSGDRVAAIARRCGFTHVVVATNAGDEAMLAAILRSTERL